MRIISDSDVAQCSPLPPSLFAEEKITRAMQRRKREKRRGRMVTQACNERGKSEEEEE